MASMMEPMDVDSSFQDDNGEDEVDTLSDVFNEDEISVIIPETRYENKSGTFTTGIDIFSKDEQQKMIERAKRFGLQNNENLRVTLQEQDLYTSMGIEEDNESAKYVRLNALHMRGTENMSTKDVFEYFGTYAPASIEWINDVSCNVVWLDKMSAARALIGLSKRIVGCGNKNGKNIQKKSDQDNIDVDDDDISNKNSSIDIIKDDGIIDGNNEKGDNIINLSAINFPLPPGIWRKGIDCPKSKTILLRFATSSDKKQQHSEKLSDYYKKYGNPNFGGMKGILTDSRKRMYKQTRSNKKKQIIEMDETDHLKRVKNPWGSLSETWGANDFVENDFIRRTRPHENRYESVLEKGSIKERLGSKFSRKESVTIDESVSEDGSDSDNEWNKRSKVMRMRMHADDEEEKVQKKRLKQLTKRMHEKMSGNDLRSRLGRSKPQIYHEAIQVIVTNTPEKYRNLRHSIDEQAELDETEEVPETFEIVEEEKEEGEWEEEDENEEKRTTLLDVTNQEQEEEINEHEEGEEESESDSSSDVSEKEIQGPQGSVIKVIPRAKPRVASTVWARLNQDAQKRNTSNLEKRDLRTTLKGDLRSRLGYHNRERSPLRIEVKNDKYVQDNSESE